VFRSKTAPKGLFQIGILAFTAFVWCAAGVAEIVVSTTAELEAALTPANAGERILVRAIGKERRRQRERLRLVA